MRLLDLIAQGRSETLCTDEGVPLPTAAAYSQALRDCPLRYVLSDELANCATQLAYADGDRLSSCLDLVHIPARQLWVEWADEARHQTLRSIPTLEVDSAAGARHAGALISASADCRSGEIRTFWSTREDLAYLLPMTTHFDLDRETSTSIDTTSPNPDWEARVGMQSDPSVGELLAHLRFRFDPQWSEYYRDTCTSETLRREVMRRNLRSCAFDAPMLIAFFLLLGARALLPRQDVRHERLNRARVRAGKPALLEHIEVSAPIDMGLSPPRGEAGESGSGRASPRLHHVRGHLVRRGSTLAWRSPHLRGTGRLGQVRSRTVLLSFERSASTLKSAL